MRQHPARSLVKGHEIVEILVSIHYLLCPLEDTVVQSVPPFHDSSSFHRGPPGPQGRGGGWGMTPASSNLISLERDAGTYVTLSWLLPLPLCIPGYSTEFPLTDEPGLRTLEEGSPPNKGLAYKLFTGPLSLHNGPRAPETPPALPHPAQTAQGSPRRGEPTAPIQIKANNWGSIQDSGAMQVNSGSTQWAF